MPGKKRILIIDDDTDLVILIKERLEHEGYEVLSAGDGIAGMEAITNEEVDLILLDIMMPRMNGIEFYQQLRADKNISNKPPVIFITAYGRTLTQENREVIGDMPIANKPFDFTHLLQLIDSKLT